MFYATTRKKARPDPLSDIALPTPAVLTPIKADRRCSRLVRHSRPRLQNPCSHKSPRRRRLTAGVPALTSTKLQIPLSSPESRQSANGQLSNVVCPLQPRCAAKPSGGTPPKPAVRRRAREWLLRSRDASRLNGLVGRKAVRRLQPRFPKTVLQRLRGCWRGSRANGGSARRAASRLQGK